MAKTSFWRDLFGRKTADPAPAAAQGDARQDAAGAPDAEAAARTRPIDNDSPIRTPAEDRLGVASFARMIARSLAAVDSAEGTVIALNAPWGGGKSSVVNLILHELRQISGEKIEVVSFNPWWFSGSTNLARGFFQALGTAMNRTMADDGKAAVSAFIGRLGSLTTYTEAAGVMAEKGVTSGVAKLLIGEFSVEEEHAKLATALRKGTKPFLVVIDDIDRLSPDEALLVFGLVKSVGRLPNVTYLLAFDRQLTTNLIKERFPSEGDQYLEKIVQATFDLPTPSPETLHRLLLEEIDRLMDVPEPETVHFLNLFHDIVAPHLVSPRQVVRLSGVLRVTWPSVAGEVNAGDFVALEALRLFRPALFRNIQQSRKLLTTKSMMGLQARADDLRRLYERALLTGVPEAQHEEAKAALKRLFPLTQGVWSNTHWGDEWFVDWERRRLVASHAHFPTYFQYALDEDVLPAAMAATLKERAGDAAFIRQTLLGGLAVTRGRGGTWAALMLNALKLAAEEIANGDVEPLLTTIFSIADQLNVAADDAGVGGFGNNSLRIHWLLRPLLLSKFDLARRSAILRAAAQTSEPGWLLDLADRAGRPYRPPDPDGPPRDLDDALVDEETAQWISALAYERMLDQVRDGSVLDHDGGGSMLWDLHRLSTDEGQQLRELTAAYLDDPALVVKLARQVTSVSLTQGLGFDGLGDRVPRREPVVQVASLPKIIDAERLHARVSEMLVQTEALQDRHALEQFLAGWNRNRRRQD